MMFSTEAGRWWGAGLNSSLWENDPFRITSHQVNMERLLLAPPLPTENGFGQQHSSGSSSGSGSSLVEFLTGRSIDLNGVSDVIGGLPVVAAQSVGAMVGGGNDEDDVVLGHHAPSYYDQNLASSSVVLHQQQGQHQQPSIDLMQHDDDDDEDALINDGEYAWMKDKKVARKNNHRKYNHQHLLTINYRLPSRAVS